MINQLSIIGLQNIGKSIVTAIRSANFAKHIVAYDEDKKRAHLLLQDKILDHYYDDLTKAIKNADLIVMTVPFNQYEKIFTIAAANMKETATITDTSPIKMLVIELAKNLLGDHFARFVPSHPVVSLRHVSDRKRPMPDIFAEKPIILTPINKTKRKSINLVKHFWQKMGGEIEIKTATENDAILATVSHLPQILAFTFINCLDNQESTLRYIRNNFKDFTNMATPCPLIWSDICIANRNAILKELSTFESNLKKVRKLLESENTEMLLEHFINAKHIRDNI